jgi:4-amino-4-deoxy-L-arabinose transferase-like glycosyltransferase
MGGEAGLRFDRRTIVLLFFLATAAGLRFAALSALPPAHYRDVALTALDALRAASGHPRLHYTYDEGLYSNLMGLFFLLFGPSDWSVRAPGALFGVLTCWGVYRLGRAIGNERAGLYGAGLLAVSFWHVLLSRSGFRAVLLPLLLSHSIALLIEGLKQGSRSRSLGAGILFGLGAHVYPSVRFAPLILPAYLLAEWRADRDGLRRSLVPLARFAAAAILVALPMIVYYVRHPEAFNYPHRIVSVFSPKLDPATIPGHLAENVLKTLLMFHVRGDTNGRHNIPGAPMLDPVSGVLFLLGLFVVCRPSRAGPATALLLGWLVAMLLPNLLSVEGVPHGLRSSGTLPALALLEGIGLAWLHDRAAHHLRERAAIAGAAAIALITLVGAWTCHRYFVVWGNDPGVAAQHDAAFRAAARALLAAPPGTERFLLANGAGFPAYGLPAETQVYLFEMRDDPPVVLGPGDAARLALSGRPALVAFVYRDPRVLQVIQSLNPGATIRALEAPGLSSESPVYRIN